MYINWSTFTVNNAKYQFSSFWLEPWLICWPVEDVSISQRQNTASDDWLLALVHFFVLQLKSTFWENPLDCSSVKKNLKWQKWKFYSDSWCDRSIILLTFSESRRFSKDREKFFRQPKVTGISPQPIIGVFWQHLNWETLLSGAYQRERQTKNQHWNKYAKNFYT